jgi:hypothetical protein
MTPKAEWNGTIGGEFTHEPASERRPEKYKFVLLVRQQRNGVEERVPESVEIHGSSITGGLFPNTDVTVVGNKGKDGWIHARQIIHKESGAITKADQLIPEPLKSILIVIVFVAVVIGILYFVVAGAFH